MFVTTYVIPVSILSIIVIAFLQNFKHILIRPKNIEKVSRHKTLTDCDSHKTSCGSSVDCIRKCFPQNIDWVCFNKICQRPKKANNLCIPSRGGFEKLAKIGHAHFWECHCLFPVYFFGLNCQSINPLLRGEIHEEFDARFNLPHTKYIVCKPGFTKVMLWKHDNLYRKMPTCVENKYEFAFL